MRRPTCCAALCAALLCACSPALDWREARPEHSGATVLFPCHPKSQTRSVQLASSSVSMTLVSCDAGDATYALSHADVGDPARVTEALVKLRSALARNLGARELGAEVSAVPGMTPNPEAVRIRLAGRLPDGTPVAEQALLFARGTHVYQAVVLGAHIDDAAAATFFESLHLPS